MVPTSKPESKALTLTLPSDREIELTRVFDAPRALVFEAHSKCEHVRHWWGPRGFTLSDGRTTLTTRSVFDTKADRDGMLQSGMESGAAETWDRLAEYLGGRS